MSLSDIMMLYVARLRARAVLVQEAFAIVGIAVGVALLFASQVAGTSLARSVAQIGGQIVGHTQLQIASRGPGGFPEQLLEDIRAVPGVTVAVPVVERQATLQGPRGQRSVDLVGTDPRFAQYAGSLLRKFNAKQLAKQEALALPRPVAEAIGTGPLEAVTVLSGTAMRQVLVGTTLGESDLGGLVHSPIALAPIEFAQRLVNMRGRINRVFIGVRPGVRSSAERRLSRIAAGASLNLQRASYESTVFAVAVAPQTQSEDMFSAVSALVGFMFALNAMLITVPSRRRMIDAVRMQGATRLMTTQVLLFDALVLGLLSCTFGLVLGDVLSIVVFHATPSYLSFAFPVGNQRIITWQTVVLAVFAGMAAAFVGVLWPLRDLIGPPSQNEVAMERRARRLTAIQALIGVLCIGVTTYVLFGDPQLAIIGNVTLVIGLACLLPFLFNSIVGAFAMLQNLAPRAASMLAVTEMQTPTTRVRSLAVAATAAIAVFGIVEFQGTQANLATGLDRSANGIDSNAAVWVSVSGESNAFATTPFHLAPDTLARLRGVGRVSSYRGSFLDWGPRRLWILAPPMVAKSSIPASQIVGGDMTRASARLRAGGWAALSWALAHERHLHVGDAFFIPSPHPIRLRVAALLTNLGWPPGAVVLNAADYARAWGSEAPSAYWVASLDGLPPAALRVAVRRALRSVPALSVETSTERERRHHTLAGQGLSRLTQIRLLVIIATVMAIAGSIGAMIWQRKELVAWLKVQGYRRSPLLGWLLCETAVLLAAGCTIGAAFGIYGQLLGSHFLAHVTGFPIIFAIEPAAAGWSFAFVSGITFVIVTLPGYLVVRVPPSTAAPVY